MSEIPIPEPPQPEEQTSPDSETLPGVQERLQALKAQNPQEPTQQNNKKDLWDKVQNEKGIPAMNLSPDKAQEAWKLAQDMFSAHVAATLPPELRELANNPTPDDPETRPEVQQRLAIVKDINEPEKSHPLQHPQAETSQDTPAMAVAPTQPPDSESLAGVRERLKQWQQEQAKEQPRT